MHKDGAGVFMDGLRDGELVMWAGQSNKAAFEVGRLRQYRLMVGVMAACACVVVGCVMYSLHTGATIMAVFGIITLGPIAVFPYATRVMGDRSPVDWYGLTTMRILIRDRDEVGFQIRGYEYNRVRGLRITYKRPESLGGESVGDLRFDVHDRMGRPVRFQDIETPEAVKAIAEQLMEASSQVVINRG
jgi:hypothetical protein